MIKKHDRVKPTKYMLLRPTEDGEPVEEYPEWMPLHVQNVSEVKITGAGVFIKTDHLRNWVNARWFQPA